MKLATLAVWIFVIGFTVSQAAEMKLAVTTSFNNSGLSDVLLPEVEKDLGLRVHLLVVGTGQALKLGKSGDVDAILVHSRAAEEAFVRDGYAPHRREIMYNDFVLIGPSDDPANIRSASTAAEALNLIRQAGAAFVSRGDDSGTHQKEMALWSDTGAMADDLTSPWYRSAGAGMGATLNTASGMGAYVLSDRASWLNFGNKGHLEILFSGDPALFNQYTYLPVSPKRHPHVRHDEGRQLEGWLTSKRGQDLIGAYRLNGERLFTPNARRGATDAAD